MQNHRDFRIGDQQARVRQRNGERPGDAWSGVGNKAVRLVEELNLRTQRLQPLLDKLRRNLRADARCCRRRFDEADGMAMPGASSVDELRANCAT